ncbi:MAG: cytochrome c biogenesis protein, partial [Planctomycetota bacterium]
RATRPADAAAAVRALPEARELLAAERAAPGDFAPTPRIEACAAALERLELTPADRIPIQRLENRYRSFLGIGAFRPVPDDDGWVGAHAALKPDRTGRGALDWQVLRDAWRAGDAGVARRCLDDLAAAQRDAGAPSPARRKLERGYNRLWKLSAAWVGFAAAFVASLIAVVSRRRRVYRACLALLGIATLTCTAGFAIRWVLSGRPAYLPPLTNQFEGLFASALLAGAFALVAEWVGSRRGRWGAARGYFALAGSLYAAVALLGAVVLLGAFETGIGQAPGILHTPLLTAHVSVIIAGHALAGMTGAISLAYLVARALGALRRRARGDAPVPGAAGAIDRCNLLTAQLATCTLLVGTALGAWWADTAWSRFWGWDPKETWSLITVAVYLSVLHARTFVPAPRRGLVTAAGCLLGVGVMLFNWIVVNYLLTGKHSYA